MCCTADEPEGTVLREVIHGKTSTHAVVSPLESKALTLLCFYERWASEKKKPGLGKSWSHRKQCFHCGVLFSSSQTSEGLSALEML